MIRSTLKLIELLLQGIEQKVPLHYLRVVQSHLEQKPLPAQLKHIIEMLKAFLAVNYGHVNFRTNEDASEMNNSEF